MMDNLMIIVGEFIQFCRAEGYEGLSDICVDPDEGYFNIQLGDEVYTKLNFGSEIRHRSYKQTDTTEEE